MIKVLGTKGVLEILAIFSIIIIVGAYITVYSIDTSSISVMLSTFTNPHFVTLSYVLDALILLIIAMLILRRAWVSETFLFKALEALVVGFTSYFVFFLVALMAIPSNIALCYLLAVSAAAALIVIKNIYPATKDIATAVSSIGVGIVLGVNFSFQYTLAILAVVAVYDYIAVFKTKEMMGLAKVMSAEDMSFLMNMPYLEYIPVNSVSIEDATEYHSYLEKTHKLESPTYRNAIEKGKLPIISNITLGEGDFGLPLMVIVSSAFFVSNPNLTYGLIISAILGLAVTMLLLKKYMRPLPAVPPLFAVMSIFTGVAAFFIFDYSALVVISLIMVGAIAMAIDIAAVAHRHKHKLTRIHVH